MSFTLKITSAVLWYSGAFTVRQSNQTIVVKPSETELEGVLMSESVPLLSFVLKYVVVVVASIWFQDCLMVT